MEVLNVTRCDRTCASLPLLTIGRRRVNSQNQSISYLKKNILKNVKFVESVEVIMIPTCEEYREANLIEEMWWNSSDFAKFQQEARSEILLFANFEQITPVEARSRLYQPSDGNTELFFLDSCATYRDNKSNANSSSNSSSSIKLYENSPRCGVQKKKASFDGEGSETPCGDDESKNQFYHDLNTCVISSQSIPLKNAEGIPDSLMTTSEITLHSALALTIVIVLSQLL